MARTRLSEEQRFWAKVALPAVPNGCMPWLASLDGKGYGQFRRGAAGSFKTCRAHRFAWEACNGPAPAGLMLDHLCGNRKCVRPDHLEPVTNQVNMQRAYAGPPRVAACRAGHEYTPANTYRYTRKNGKTFRTCRICQRRNVRAYQQRARGDR